MRNVLTFDVRGECSCACVGAFYDGSEKIKLIYEADSYTAPTVKVTGGYNDETIDPITIDLTVENGFAVGEFPIAETIEKYPMWTYSFQYIDGEKIGTTFTLSFGGAGSFQKSTYSSLYVTYGGDLAFKWRYISTIPTTRYSNSTFDTDEETGEITLKTAKKITAEMTGDTITKITIMYDDDTSNTYSCGYDTDGRLTQFGSLPITYTETGSG